MQFLKFYVFLFQLLKELSSRAPSIGETLAGELGNELVNLSQDKFYGRKTIGQALLNARDKRVLNGYDELMNDLVNAKSKPSLATRELEEIKF